MPNICGYSIKVKGTPNNVKKFYKWLGAYYSYENIDNPICYYTDDNGNKHNTNHHIGYRVFTCEHEEVPNGKKQVEVFGYGECAWSVDSCMLNNGGYLTTNARFNNLGYALSLEDACKLAKVNVEIFSCENGMGFAEHCIVNRYGERECYEEVPFYSVFLDGYDNYDALVKDYKNNNWELPTTFTKEKFDYYIEQGYNVFDDCDYFVQDCLFNEWNWET